MRSLYGTRSIIPNNYYFTFDRIYDQCPEEIIDEVLIGRAVLYTKDSSVYVKTAEGYKKVAILDNTGRLIRNEGYVLKPQDGDVNINELSGDGFTYNGDGVYIINYEDLFSETPWKVAKTYSNEDIYYIKQEDESYIPCICANNYINEKYKNFYYARTTDEYVPLYTLSNFDKYEGFSDSTGPLYSLKSDLILVDKYSLLTETALSSGNNVLKYYYLDLKESFNGYLKVTKQNDINNIRQQKSVTLYKIKTDEIPSEVKTIKEGETYYVKNPNGDYCIDNITLNDNSNYIVNKIIHIEDDKDHIYFNAANKDRFSLISTTKNTEDSYDIYSDIKQMELVVVTNDEEIDTSYSYFIQINFYNFLKEYTDKRSVSIVNFQSSTNIKDYSNRGIYYPIIITDAANKLQSVVNERIINEETFKETENDSIQLWINSTNDMNPLNNWPSIRGLPKEEYLKNSVFLLEQRSNSPIQNDATTMFQVTQQSVTNTMNNLYTYSTEGAQNKIEDNFLNEPVSWHLATSSGLNVGQKAIFEMELYQILTDISYQNDNLDIQKLDKDYEDRKTLNHLNKTFIRKGKKYFYLTQWLEKNNGSTGNTNTKITNNIQYSYEGDCGFLSISEQTKRSSSENLYNACTVWGEWEDITEQYTGYIGDLDPNTVGFMSPVDTKSQEEYVPAQLPYNKHTQYYIIDNQKEYKSANIDQVTFDNSFKTEDNNGVLSWNDKSSIYYVKANANRGNLNDSNTLVEATNTLDEIIGSRTRLNNIEKEGQVNKIVQGDLSSSLNDDNRPYKIPEKDIMDALVHHDADIGAIENLSNIDIKDENGNIIVSNNTYNLTFTKQNEQPDNIDSSNNNTVKVRSLTDAIVKTDNIIGHVERIGRDGFVNKQLHSKKKITGTGSGQDERYYNIEEQNLIDTIVHHDADIGCIEKINTLSKQQNHLGTHNLNFVSTGDYTYLDNENNQISDINSLTEAIVKLDNMVGYLGRLNANNKNGDCVNTNSGTQGITGTGNTKEDDIENNQIFSDARPYNIPETTVIDTLVHHDADIGAIEDLKARQGSDNNTNNLNFTTAKDPTDTDKLKGVNDIQSIKDALIILDNLIGARRRLSDTTLATNDTTLINSNADSNDKRPVNIPENNIIDSIIHHDADIGEIEKLNTTNTSERTMNNNNLIYSSSATNQKIRKENDEWKVAEIRSLTDAIEALDKIIGPITGFNGKTISGMASDLDNIIDYPYDLNDTRSINIPDNNIIYAIGHHDADIGAIENISQKNTNNLNFVNNGSFSNLNNKNNQTSNINSLTEAIIKEDNMIGYIGRLGQSKKNVSETDGTQGVTGTGGATDPDIRPYSIPETTVIDTLVHHDADIGFIEKLNGNNIEFTQKEKDENNKHEIHSLTDAITILDNIIGNYDKIEQLKGSNLEEKNADLVTAINHLSEFIIGYKSDLENKNNLIEEEKRATLVAAINALNTVLGEFNIENTNNLKDTENIKTFIQAIKVLDTKIGSVGENSSLQEQIDEITGTMSDTKDMMKYINNLGLNLDILTHTVNNISNNIALEWGTF